MDAAHRLKPTLGETPTWEEVRDEATKKFKIMDDIQFVSKNFRITKNCGIRVPQAIKEICIKIADDIKNKTPKVQDHSMAARLI